MTRMAYEAAKNGLELAVLVTGSVGIYGARQAMRALERRLG